MAVTVHGDDFTATGSEADTEWFEGILAEAYEITSETLGPNPAKHKQEIRVLNRVLAWHSWGIGYEADPRHAEIVLKDLGLEESRPVSTPGTKADQKIAHALNGDNLDTLDPEGLKNQEVKVEEANTTALEGAEATLFRAICARLNYLAQDRPDIKFAVKEAARHMARPCTGD